MAAGSERKKSGNGEGSDRRAVLHLCGIGEDASAELVLEIAEQVRRAVTRLGIRDLRIEVRSHEEMVG